MKTEIRMNEGAVEVWYDEKLIGHLAGAEGPGVQVISPHPMLPQWHADIYPAHKLVEVRIAVDTPGTHPYPATRR